jgi:hypothetical protein
MNSLFSEQVSRYSKLDAESFIAHHVIPGIPAIFTNLADDWPARQKWSLDYILNSLQEKNISITKSVGVHHGKNKDYDSADMDLLELLTTMETRYNITLDDREARYYLRAWRFWKELPELLDDFSMPEVFSDKVYSQTQQPHDYTWFFIGEAGTYTPTHLDYGYNSAWLYLVEGLKEWRFIQCPYFQTPEVLKKLNSDEKRCNPDQIDLFNNDTINGEYLTMQSWTALLEPGEIIWTPTQCLHAVRNIETSFALTCNYINTTNANITQIWPHDPAIQKLIAIL